MSDYLRLEVNKDTLIYLAKMLAVVILSFYIGYKYGHNKGLIDMVNYLNSQQQESQSESSYRPDNKAQLDAKKDSV